jgi:hypothetical protein
MVLDDHISKPDQETPIIGKSRALAPAFLLQHKKPHVNTWGFSYTCCMRKLLG